jgi:hypothetical protein
MFMFVHEAPRPVGGPWYCRSSLLLLLPSLRCCCCSARGLLL